MSENPPSSACIPPPSSYTPRARPPQSSATRMRGQGGRGYNINSNNNNNERRRGYQQQTFQRDQSSSCQDDRKKYQPQDRFHRNEDDDYFARVQDEEEDEEKVSVSNEDGEDEDDPLDAYMKSLESASAGRKYYDLTGDSKSDTEKGDSEKGKETNSSTHVSDVVDKKAIRLDIDETDDIEESYYQYVEQNKNKKPAEVESEGDSGEDKQNQVEYDNDGNIISVRKLKRDIDPLPPIDHSTVSYESFEKVFYQEHDEIEKLTQEQGEELRKKLEIKVSGDSPPKPVCSFAHFKFDEQLMKVIRRSEYTQPTPIQAQAIPAALLGRNIIGIAMTGSGKTAAYLWPMIVHIMGQPDLKHGDGPIALVLVPTRELALQVYGEAKKFSHSYRIAVVCAYGGGSKYEQSQDLELGAEVVVATPGRLIDLIKMGVTNLRRVTYLVLDEADRFFEMGFEAQVRSICDHIRPDRQTLLFSATFKKKIEQLARTVTENPVKIIQKSLGEANEDVTQHVIVVPEAAKKWSWITEKLVELTSAGSVLIFVTRIVNSEELHNNLKQDGRETLLLHGDMEQSERNRVITAFKRKEKDVMIATDVAARGLDIAHIRTVINYDVARDIDTHIHRVGRTGRAGLKGDAYTLISDKDKEFAVHLVKNLESSNQEVGADLMKLAMQSHAFRKSRASGRSGHRSHHGAANKFGADTDRRTHHHHQHQHQQQRETSTTSTSYHNKQQNYSHRHHMSGRDKHSGHNNNPHQHQHRSSSTSYTESSSRRMTPDSSFHDEQRKRSRWH